MDVRKKIIRKAAEYLFLFLLFCTALSSRMQRVLLPQVAVSAPAPGTVLTDGKEVQYEYTLPVSALKWEGDRYWAYFIYTKEGKFGKEQFVQMFPVDVAAQDGTTAALRISLFDEVVVWMDCSLEDGMRVMVQGTPD